MPNDTQTKEDRLLDTVEQLVEKVEEKGTKQDKAIEALSVTVKSAVEDQKAFAEVLKNNSVDKAAVETIVGEILGKFEAERTRAGIMGAGSAKIIKATDPWDVKSDYFAWDLKQADLTKDSRPLLEAVLCSSAKTDTQREFQHMATDVMIANALASAAARNAGESYDPRGAGFVKYFPRMNRKWLQHQAAILAEFTGKATVAPDDLASTANWVPTGASPEVRDLIMLATSVGSLFDHLVYQGAGTNYDLPVDLTDTVADYITEQTGYVIPYQAADPTQLGQAIVDAKCTFAFKKHRGRFIFSGELVEDSIVPILERVRKKLFETMAHGEEDAWINGQLTASIDTGASAPGTYSIRKAHNGLRYFCSAGVVNSLFDGGSVNLLYSHIMGARAVMGENGVVPSDLALILGPAGYMQALKLAETMTADKFGDRATVFSGALAAIAGMPVVVSRYVPQDMNASGIRDATTTTQTIAILVNRRGWLACEKRDITVESVRLPQTDQTDVIAMRRMDIESLYGYATSGTPKTACVIYNLDTALA